MEDKVREMLEFLGEDPDRQGLQKTPHRYTEAMKYLTRGYHQDAEALINEAIFDATYDEMVTIRDIDFYSMCEHHLLPFFGKVHVAYLPKGKIVGLSKIPRIVDLYARRLQVQEKMTEQIAKCLQTHLEPLGVAVVVEAFHMCMAMRGVEKQSSRAITSTMLGAFRNDPKTRNEFMNLVTSTHSALTR